MIQSKLPWVIAAVLAALLIIVTFLWLNAVSRLDNGNLTVQRDLIREYCAKTDADSRARCQEEIEDMTTMLEKFSRDLQNLPAAQVVEIGTSSAETTTGQ